MFKFKNIVFNIIAIIFIFIIVNYIYFIKYVKENYYIDIPTKNISWNRITSTILDTNVVIEPTSISYYQGDSSKINAKEYIKSAYAVINKNIYYIKDITNSNNKWQILFDNKIMNTSAVNITCDIFENNINIIAMASNKHIYYYDNKTLVWNHLPIVLINLSCSNKRGFSIDNNYKLYYFYDYTKLLYYDVDTSKISETIKQVSYDNYSNLVFLLTLNGSVYFADTTNYDSINTSLNTQLNFIKLNITNVSYICFSKDLLYISNNILYIYDRSNQIPKQINTTFNPIQVSFNGYENFCIVLDSNKNSYYTYLNF